MDKKLKRKWLTALESGKFEKTTHRLLGKDNKSYCCLGVLGIVCGLGNGQLKRMISGDHNDKYKNDKLSNRFLKKVGLSNSQQNELANLNDKSDTFFSVIDYIRTNI